MGTLSGVLTKEQNTFFSHFISEIRGLEPGLEILQFSQRDGDMDWRCDWHLAREHRRSGNRGDLSGECDVEARSSSWEGQMSKRGGEWEAMKLETWKGVTSYRTCGPE